MMNRETWRQNLLWFMASLALSFFVWMIATAQNDPIVQRPYLNIPVQVEVDDGLIVANPDAIQPIRVSVRARQSVLNALTVNDITARANLHGLGPGLHTIELDVRASRPAFVDPIPRQYTIELAQRIARQKPVQPNIIANPPTGFTYTPEDIVYSDRQVLVTGMDARVNQVDRLLFDLDLSQQRSDFNADVPLYAVDINGRRVTGVEIAQPTVNVTIDIVEVPGEFELPIFPDVDYASVPPGYTARLGSYRPETISITVPPELSDQRPNLMYTERIDLTGRTSSFTISVPVQPVRGLTIINNQPVEVTILIEATIGQRQYDAIPVEFLSQNPDYDAEVIPSTITVLLTGPQPVLDRLRPEDISASVDLTGLGPGRYDRPVTVTVSTAAISPQDIRVVPSAIVVFISERQPAAP